MNCFQERKLAEEERIRKEKEMDYLAPFLARIGDPPELTRRDMEEVAEVRAPSTMCGQLNCMYTYLIHHVLHPPSKHPSLPHTHTHTHTHTHAHTHTHTHTHTHAHTCTHTHTHTCTPTELPKGPQQASCGCGEPDSRTFRAGDRGAPAEAGLVQGQTGLPHEGGGGGVRHLLQ